MHYFKCPKCDHAPLPRDQALPAACPACGLVLAKYGTAPPPKPVQDEGDEAAESRADRMRALLFPEGRPVAKAAWQARQALLALLGIWTLWIWFDMDIRNGEAGTWFIHVVLLPFHEAGHYIVFPLFGKFMTALGGTIAQHLMPIIAAGALLVVRKDAFGAAVFTWLLGVSVILMAVYMYDAYDPRLMLLSGTTGREADTHDWQNIFGDLGIIRRARGIGLFFGAVGMAIIAAALAWAARVLVLQGRRLEGSPQFTL